MPRTKKTATTTKRQKKKAAPPVQEANPTKKRRATRSSLQEKEEEEIESTEQTETTEQTEDTETTKANFSDDVPDYKIQSSAENLKKLLESVDPDQLTNVEDYEPVFDKIADQLLSHYVFKIAGSPYRILEIEFYFNGGAHPDSLTHSDTQQQSCGEWYFHRTGGKLRGGSYKGLDITFGVPNKGFGGILLRAIQSLTTSDIINGTSLIVDHILQKNGYATTALDQFVKTLNVSVSAKSPLYLLESDEDLPKLEVFKGPRVGLTLKKHNKGQENFIAKDYRYLILPAKIKKGKVNTVLGMIGQGKSTEDIHMLTATPLGTIKGYVEDFKKGKELDSAQSFYGKAISNSLLCKLYGYEKRDK